MPRHLVINARPNTNGNSDHDFQEAYMAFNAAQKQLTVAAKKLMTDVLHGRNYPHWDRPEDQAINDRTEAWRKIHDADAAIGELMSAIVNVLEDV